MDAGKLDLKDWRHHLVLPPVIFALGFSLRKWAILKRFVAPSAVRLVGSARQIPEDGTLVLWGMQVPPAHLAKGVRIVRVEDGFLRSVGLGAELSRPMSWVLDDVGIYFDATRPSRLEQILANDGFDDALLTRAASLRKEICQRALTKYNVGTREWHRPVGVSRVVLVPGQVESDASIRFGSCLVRTNMDLLRAVRSKCPDAWILYKPHPDVLAGLRKSGEGEVNAAMWCDELVTDVSMGKVLSAVDEVHVLTSLAGFEALLRGKLVVCYGLPFYAGWGLTTDLVACSRRGRKLSLDALVAGALISYPVYASHKMRGVTTPERSLAELAEWRNRVSDVLPFWRKVLRWFLTWRRY